MTKEELVKSLEFCLTNGKCTECEYKDENKSLLTCRILMEECLRQIKNNEQSNNGAGCS